ncbi:MAG: PQQ-binding-like beta-propeller repeat protein [Phycisphaerae bacterium]|jgi:outer membrane protein assembly factor BamB|nr:PQQ-binding-like beta-propeller repeat protein [Phycisphaerae bacterium]
MTTRNKTASTLAIAALLGLCFTAISFAADWPGFLGPNRDGHSPDKGLLKKWPADGPPLLWKVKNIGPGWSSMSVVDGNVYTTGNSGGNQMLICLDINGKEKWRVKQGPEAPNRGYPGARSTPTIDGKLLYVTGGAGAVTCHSITDGRVIWERNMKSDMGGRVGGWKYAESVLILGKLAIITPGGSNAIVALNKLTGKTVWKSDVSGTAGYSSCITITEGGSTIICNGSQSGLMFVDAKTGKLLGQSKFAAPNTANCPTPAYSNGYLFWAVGYGKGAICLKVANRSGKWSFKEAWRSRDFNCHPGNYVVHGGKVYGKGRRGLTCADLKTGETDWQDRVSSGQVAWADGMLYVQADRGGKVTLVDPSASSDRVKGAFSVDGRGSSWSHPIIIDGRLFVRYDTNLYCFNVKAK